KVDAALARELFLDEANAADGGIRHHDVERAGTAKDGAQAVPQARARANEEPLAGGGVGRVDDDALAMHQRVMGMAERERVREQAKARRKYFGLLGLFGGEKERERAGSALRLVCEHFLILTIGEAHRLFGAEV